VGVINGPAARSASQGSPVCQPVSGMHAGWPVAAGLYRPGSRIGDASERSVVLNDVVAI